MLLGCSLLFVGDTENLDIGYCAFFAHLGRLSVHMICFILPYTYGACQPL